MFQIIFGESLHVEVLKKSYFLLEFLHDCKAIGEKEIGLMWECASEKHEAYRVAILKAMNHIAARADSKGMRHIFERLKGNELALDKSQLVLLRTLAKSASIALGTVDATKVRAVPRQPS